MIHTISSKLIVWPTIVKINNDSPKINVRINSTKKCAFFPRMSKEFQSKASQGFSNTSHAC